MDNSKDTVESVRRRRLLLAAGGTATMTLAGCLGEEDAQQEPAIKDSDGDGVIDSKDYAPKDGSVQERSDLAGEPGKRTTTPVTRTATPTPTPTPMATPTPTAITTRTPTPAPPTNTITVEGDFNISHIEEYSSERLGMILTGADPNLSQFSGLESTVFAINEDGDMLDVVGRGDPITYRNADTRSSVDLDVSSLPTETRFQLFVLLLPEGRALEEVDSSEVVTIHQTDFIEKESNGQLRRTAQPAALQALSDSESENHELLVKEGAISVKLSGRSQGQQFTTSYYLYKHAYLAARKRSHSRSRSEFVTYEMNSGFASFFGNLFTEDARALGLESDVSIANFAIDVIQHIPYVPDDVSTGYDDYTKYIAEVMGDCGGDCEDTSVLLASLLQLEPFGYDTVLIQPPGHMGVGILGDDSMTGSYWEYQGEKYYYIETTGIGWAVGDYPDDLGDDAYVYQV
ncbi:hypothetical protein ACFPYI_08640 [Halomarina salina]|uniref:Transglutaminase domain-containing protein n=1 Tax=Halomarina salina TaxID=1872699 RepID=A0ABD5RLV1_9EURY|nr:hypothetical protein [Halomarina salina]